MKKLHFLLDMDGVLVDFLSGAIESLNKEFDRSITIDQYVKEFGQWGTYDYYGITVQQFWTAIHSTPDFWFNLKPIPWYDQIYKLLSGIGDVTIVTAPSEDPDCAKQKLLWLRKHLDIGPDKVFLGTRKYLMAGNGILIDDYQKNVESFKLAGGQAILIPSTWNTPNLTWERVCNTILSTMTENSIKV
jgi:5'(3')-deoxyribonucleotidase